MNSNIESVTESLKGNQLLNTFALYIITFQLIIEMNVVDMQT